MNRDAAHPGPLDLSALRRRLAGASGPEYWRCLEELAATPEFQGFLHREFPENASEWRDPQGRRDFLKLMTASLALAGLAACTKQPAETIVPYVRAPEQFIPGLPLFYATAVTLGGYASGVLAESHMGRPTKLEGNELHPASLGATCAFTQAEILTLYDPARAQTFTRAGRNTTPSEFLAAAGRALQIQKARRGAGLRFLTEAVTSPSLAALMAAFQQDFPEMRWHAWEPASREQARAGTRLAFGAPLDAKYDFARADVVLSLDADFLGTGPAAVRYARDFTSRRKVRGGEARLNRLYLAESSPSNTGSMADERLPVRAAEIEALAREMARRVGVPGVAAAEPDVTGRHEKWIAAAARDLAAHRGRCIVIAGEQQSPMAQALAHAMNLALGNVGATLTYFDPVEASPLDHTESLKSLAADMAAKRVDLLLVLGGNPVYDAPADLDFERLYNSVPLRAHFSLYHNETSALSHWHAPAAHALEAWGDARAFDGTVTIQQPLIQPLYGAKSVYEFVSSLAGRPGRSGYEIIREFWRSRLGAAGFDSAWRRAVHDGIVPGTAQPPKNVALSKEFAAQAARPHQTEITGLEIVFRADPCAYDGRFAENGWLQELPRPMTRITWDNAALVAPRTAERLGLAGEDVVELRYAGRRVQAPVWVMPGQAEDSVTLHLGYGRSRAGHVGSGVGFNAYALRTAAAPWFCSGLEVAKTGRRHSFAATQYHHTMEGRHLVRSGTLEEFRRNPAFAQEMGETPPRELTLYPNRSYQAGYSWGLAVDLGSCTGCNACVIACQAENIVPIVGKEQVARGREMHWIRIDRYFKGGMDHPEIVHQPVMCQHCENAPCEVVCPVAATVHSDEGLNDMVYNRCVGTRYCSNNCPYKVRRFNFLAYTDETTPVLKLLRNPDVTVRSRGVMEKCTYCVQRINEKRIVAERENRRLRDGEILTACQQVCPAEAIVFGDINDPQSRVSRLRAEKLNYSLLGDLNTRPRTTYLARLANPGAAEGEK